MFVRQDTHRQKASHSEAQAVSCLPASKELLQGQEQRELGVEVVILWLQWQQLELCFPTPGPALNSCKRNVLYRARLNVNCILRPQADHSTSLPRPWKFQDAHLVSPYCFV